MPANNDRFSKLTGLQPVIDEIFHNEYALAPNPLDGIYGVRTSEKAAEHMQRIGTIPEPVEFAGAIEYAELLPDYEITFTHVKYARGFQVEFDTIEDMQVPNVLDQTANLGVGFSRKVLKDFAAPFNNATSNTGYDAVSLLSASHPRSDTDATTVSNLGTDALNSDNLETGILAMQDFGDDLGEEVLIDPTHLMVPRALRKTGFELTASPMTPEDANTASNIHSSGLTLIVNPYLTDTNRWYLIDQRLSQRSLLWFWRLRPGSVLSEDDFDKEARLYKNTMRYSFGYTDWRFVYGSEAS